jgi:predicted RNA-binding Zn-ribbon protein involved in translation (DUF1610 family)
MIEQLFYECDHTSYERESGTCALDGTDCSGDDYDFQDGESENYTYKCPECNAEIDTEDILDEPPEGAECYSATNQNIAVPAAGIIEDGAGGMGSALLVYTDGSWKPSKIPLLECLCGHQEMDEKQATPICPECGHMMFAIVI